MQRDVNEGRAVLNFSEWPQPQKSEGGLLKSTGVVKCRRPRTRWSMLTHALALPIATDSREAWRGPLVVVRNKRYTSASEAQRPDA